MEFEKRFPPFREFTIKTLLNCRGFHLPRTSVSLNDPREERTCCKLSLILIWDLMLIRLCTSMNNLILLFFYSCFLALLLIAAVLWKIKQKFDRYRWVEYLAQNFTTRWRFAITQNSNEFLFFPSRWHPL